MKDSATGQGRGCAFVKMSSKEEAFYAINSLNGKHVWEGCSRPMEVRFAESRAQRQQMRQSPPPAAVAAAVACAAAVVAVSCAAAVVAVSCAAAVVAVAVYAAITAAACAAEIGVRIIVFIY